MAKSPSSSEPSWGERLTGWFSGRRERERLREELAALEPVEYEAILRDCGLSEVDLEAAVQRNPATYHLLERLMAALKIDRSAIGSKQPELLHELELACVSCGDWRHCKKALEHGTAARDFDTYCPNAPQLKALQAKRAA